MKLFSVNSRGASLLGYFSCRLDWCVIVAVLLSAGSVALADSDVAGGAGSQDPVSGVESRGAGVKRHLPTSKKGVEASAETAVRAIVPKDPKMAERYARVRVLHASKAAYLEAAAKGEVQPFAEVVHDWSRYQANLAKASELRDAYQNEADLAAKASLHAQLMGVLQPLGFLLQGGSYQDGHKNILSKAQVAELEDLGSRFSAAADTATREQGELRLVSAAHLYALTHVPTEIVVQAPPHTEVLFQAEAGGLFPNKLSVISVTADAQGIARTSWVTKGDAIHTCPVSYQSPSAWGRGQVEIELVQLKLIDPQTFSLAVDAKSVPQPSLRKLEGKLSR